MVPIPFLMRIFLTLRVRPDLCRSLISLIFSPKARSMSRKIISVPFGVSGSLRMRVRRALSASSVHRKFFCFKAISPK